MKKESIFKDNEVYWDELENRPRKIRGHIEVKKGHNPEETARTFLRDNKEMFKLGTDEKDLKLIQKTETPLGHHLHFQQYIEGIPVFGGTVMVHLDHIGNIRQVNDDHELVSRVLPATRDKVITKKEAEKIARDAIAEPINLRPNGKIEVETLYYPTQDGLKLSQCVTMPTLSPTHDWRVFVDAYTGEVLLLEDLIVFQPVDGEGLVFDPNPVVTANNNTFRDGITPEATLDAERVIGRLRELVDPVGGVYSLIGPYCRIINLANPDTGIPQEADPNNFKYPRVGINFEAVNVYYHIDTLQRFIQETLGITTANKRRTDADPHDNTLIAAWYSPATKDLHFSDSGPSRPDRGEDGDCMAHEYGHAIQDNIVPGWGWGLPVSGTNRYESRAIGEGFGDILAVLYFVTAGNGYQRQVVEDWIFVHQDLGGGLRGLRRVDHAKKYSAFELAVYYPMKRKWDYKEYPNSEIWSGSLWDIFLSMGGDSLFPIDWEAPRNELLKALILSIHLLTARASMPEAAEALLTTHCDLKDQFGRIGRHAIEMVDVFHDREILECATGSDLRVTNLWSQQDDSSIRGWERVEYGQDNWFYAEIKNEGTSSARSLVVVFSFKCPFSTPVYPTDFREHIISAAVEFNLAPGETRIIKARWPKELIPPLPAEETMLHGCIFAEIYNPVDHVPPGATTLGGGNGKLQQCNTDIIDLLPDELGDYFFTMSNFHITTSELVRLEVVRPPKWENMEISFHFYDPVYIKWLWRRIDLIEARFLQRIGEVVKPKREVRILQPTQIAVRQKEDESDLIMNLASGSSLMIPDQSVQDVDFSARVDGNFIRRDAVFILEENEICLNLSPGQRVGFPYIMRPRDRVTVNMKIKAPKDAKPGDQFTIDVIQRNTRGKWVGGFNIRVNIVDKKR